MIYPDRIEVLHWLYSRLKPHRFLHTLGVEQLAVQLAMRHHLSIEMASSAALLHDCAKNMPMEELLKVCDEAGVDLKRNQDYPQLLHAFAAPIVAQKQFGPLPEELLNAIRFHTTGRSPYDTHGKTHLFGRLCGTGTRTVSWFDGSSRSHFPRFESGYASDSEEYRTVSARQKSKHPFLYT